MWFSRWREYRADASGASLAGRQSMINALQRLMMEQQHLQELPGELTAFGISGGRKSLSELFMTHPKLEDRIAALQRG